MLQINPEIYALTSYVQGALDAHATAGYQVAGATLARITEVAVEYVNAYLVVTSQASIHRAAYDAGYAYAKAQR